MVKLSKEELSEFRLRRSAVVMMQESYQNFVVFMKKKYKLEDGEYDVNVETGEVVLRSEQNINGEATIGAEGNKLSA